MTCVHVSYTITGTTSSTNGLLVLQLTSTLSVVALLLIVIFFVFIMTTYVVYRKGIGNEAMPI